MSRMKLESAEQGNAWLHRMNTAKELCCMPSEPGICMDRPQNLQFICDIMLSLGPTSSPSPVSNSILSSQGLFLRVVAFFIGCSILRKLIYSHTQICPTVPCILSSILARQMC